MAPSLRQSLTGGLGVGQGGGMGWDGGRTDPVLPSPPVTGWIRKTHGVLAGRGGGYTCLASPSAGENRQGEAKDLGGGGGGAAATGGGERGGKGKDCIKSRTFFPPSLSYRKPNSTLALERAPFHKIS